MVRGIGRMALGGLSGIGTLIAGAAMGMAASMNPPSINTVENVPSKRRHRAQATHRKVIMGRSKWMPHQGDKEIARRKRQIDAGQLRITDEPDGVRSVRLAMNGIGRVVKLEEIA